MGIPIQINYFHSECSVLNDILIIDRYQNGLALPPEFMNTIL